MLPLGAFLALHVASAALLIVDSRWFIDLQSWSAASPALAWIEITLVWLPLLLHAAYGAWLTLSGGTLRPQRPATATLLIRLSGFATLSFIAYHALEFRFAYPAAELDATDMTQKLYAQLSATTGAGFPLTGALYLLGLAVAVFHAGYGTYWMYAASHSAAQSSRIARWLGWSASALFLVGAQSIVYCATGSRFFFW